MTEADSKRDGRKRQIVKANNALPTAQQHSVKLKSGKLIIDSKEYQPKYEQLTAADLLTMDHDE